MSGNLRTKNVNYEIKWEINPFYYRVHYSNNENLREQKATNCRKFFYDCEENNPKMQKFQVEIREIG